jgi:hypothetical protein
MEYVIYDTLAEGLELRVEQYPSAAAAQAFRLARYLGRPVIVDGFGLHITMNPDGSEEPLPPNWRPPF